MDYKSILTIGIVYFLIGIVFIFFVSMVIMKCCRDISELQQNKKINKEEVMVVIQPDAGLAIARVPQA